MRHVVAIQYTRLQAGSPTHFRAKMKMIVLLVVLAAWSPFPIAAEILTLCLLQVVQLKRCGQNYDCVSLDTWEGRIGGSMPSGSKAQAEAAWGDRWHVATPREGYPVKAIELTAGDQSSCPSWTEGWQYIHHGAMFLHFSTIQTNPNSDIGVAQLEGRVVQLEGGVIEAVNNMTASLSDSDKIGQLQSELDAKYQAKIGALEQKVEQLEEMLLNLIRPPA
ncbi:unnamed protein product [Vitrella brassicaformis CCMP3155]|uniref:Uncharacterized protein n=2 Tax=Vitrella brassicaformis TaxID=1169539 RepID=A0A0G4EUQ0_VITBC|nr:unnamed protein product [Vitrella brassicaformis CCMP3155]|mmetsp:Transcript_33373/g.96405  ORF Transcript_33373/g.96405 Transcript_33373/m.96405 type:complete len:220 (+) Transcript_33373:152-811(+)|eukprot:CEM02314.1 unnamed protein product [Vitrella brassicaformis CCMP3155]